MSIRVELLHSNVMHKVVILKEEFNVNVITDASGFEVVSVYKNEILLDDKSEECQNIIKTFNALKKEGL